MSYFLNSVNLATYGIKAGHAPSSNISLSGCYDMPSRIGKTHHSWGDENNYEPYVEADEIQFAGRDIHFQGYIMGTPQFQRDNIALFYTALSAFTTLVPFVTPYGTFNVLVKNTTERCVVGGCFIDIIFREPIVDLTGTLPTVGANANKIDGIPMGSFGLYYSSGDGFRSIANMKEGKFSKYGSEGYQMTKRDPEILTFNGFLLATSLQSFDSNVKALYKLFAGAGLRTFVLSTYVQVIGFLTNGF